jgi:hypothetical protein
MAVVTERRPWPYLSPDAARGCAYCLDPDSLLLRRSLTTRPQRDTPLARDALLADLPFLRRLMEKVYAGYPDLLQHPDFDPDAFFRGWEAHVRETGSGTHVPFGTAVVQPLAALHRVVSDSHFYVGSELASGGDEWSTYYEFQTPLPAGAVAEQCTLSATPHARPSTLRTAPLLGRDGRLTAVLTVSAAGSSAALTLQRGDAELVLTRRPAVPRTTWQPPVPAYDWHVVADTTVITLRTFGGNAAVREQLRQLASDYAEHARQPRIVFDLRGNGGGSLEYVDQWIGRARHGTWRTYPRLEVVGALWPCSAWNWVVEQQIREGRADTTAARTERDRLREAWDTRRPPHTSTLDAGFRENLASAPYDGRVYVLVDRYSGSSGELAAVQLKRALGATVLGERTAGAMQYAQVRRLVLPHTGLVCQVPTKRFFFDEEVERVGWPVDVYLEDVTQDAATLVPHLDRLDGAPLAMPERPV